MTRILAFILLMTMAGVCFGKDPGLVKKPQTSNKNDSLAAISLKQAGEMARAKSFDKATSDYENAITLAPKEGSRRTLMLALKQAAAFYEDQKNYHKALDYFRQAYDIADSLDFVRKTQESSTESFSRNFLGDVMGSLRQKPQLAQDILKTIAVKQSLNDTLALTINYFNLGVLYKSKHQFDDALSALQNCLHYAAQINYTDMQSSAANEIADLYEQQGNYQQAIIYLQKRVESNALRGSKNSRTIDELQTRYEITQREDQVLRQQFELKQRSYWIVGISIVTALLIVIGFIYYRQTQLKQRNIAMQAIIDTEESERKRIAQDLHDSVSQTISAAKMNLSAIGSELPFANDDQRRRFERVIGMVDDGFREVRTISHNMMPWALNQTGLAQVIKQFVGNFEDKSLDIGFFSRGFEEPFDATTEIILYRILQESVNNVIKHAQASRIDISLIRDTDSISMTIEDNGRGFDASRPEVYRGMGLNNLQSRINFLKGKVEIDSQPGRGTLVSVYIPL